MKKPREPNHEEKRELYEFIIREAGGNADAGLVVIDACIAVFDNYITDCPGYTGKVMIVVWPGGPDLTETYTWGKNGIRRESIRC